MVINPHREYCKCKRRTTDDNTLQAILDVKVPDITTLDVSCVLGLSYKQTLKRIRRLELEGVVRRQKVDSKYLIHVI